MKIEEKKYLEKVSHSGCCVCRLIHGDHDPAIVEIHHQRSGIGKGQRASHFQVAGMCAEHHRGKTGIHGMGLRAFERHYGVTEIELVQQTQIENNYK